jgi:hypothetical protein
VTALLLTLSALVLVKTRSPTFPLASVGLLGANLIGLGLAAYTLAASPKR